MKPWNDLSKQSKRVLTKQNGWENMWETKIWEETSDNWLKGNGFWRLREEPKIIKEKLTFLEKKWENDGQRDNCRKLRRKIRKLEGKLTL